MITLNLSFDSIKEAAVFLTAAAGGSSVSFMDGRQSRPSPTTLAREAGAYMAEQPPVEVVTTDPEPAPVEEPSKPQVSVSTFNPEKPKAEKPTRTRSSGSVSIYTKQEDDFIISELSSDDARSKPEARTIELLAQVLRRDVKSVRNRVSALKIRGDIKKRPRGRTKAIFAALEKGATIKLT